jgi:RNA polymerase sigma factor (sigma-70 family)
MKKHRKQSVYVYGRKRLVDVPIDDELYKADNRAEYQRARSKAKHVSMDKIALTSFADDIAEAYEKAQLLECLRATLKLLTERERLLIKCIFYDRLTEQETAAILKIARQNVNKKKHKIIKKLRNSLKDWL